MKALSRCFSRIPELSVNIVPATRTFTLIRQEHAFLVSQGIAYQDVAHRAFDPDSHHRWEIESWHLAGYSPP
jgi:hypothetical protein